MPAESNIHLASFQINKFILTLKLRTWSQTYIKYLCFRLYNDVLKSLNILKDQVFHNSENNDLYIT